jgi:hypothetical protein
MARPLRIEFAENERKPVFRSKGDRERFLSYLDSAHHRYVFRDKKVRNPNIRNFRILG